MALTRAFLRSLGLEDNQVTAVIEAHTETVDGIRADSTKAQEELNKKVDALKTELAGAKDGDSEWKDKYDTLSKEFESYKTEQNAKADKAAKTSAYKALLKAAGVADKRVDSVMKVTALDDITLNKDGSIRDAEKITENIKTEWADFIVQTQQKGAPVNEPPAGGKTYASKAEIMAIKNTAQRQQAIADNMDLFTN